MLTLRNIRVWDTGEIIDMVIPSADARNQPEDGGVIEGLYALGNTAANAFGAVYPGAGATIAQGLVYGYIAGRDAAGQL